MHLPVFALVLVALSSLAAAAPNVAAGQSGAVTVRGELVDAEKRPVVGFPLTAAVYADGKRLFETTVVTAAHGRYEVRLPPPPNLAAKPRVRVCVSVDSDGYQARASFSTYRTKGVRMHDLVAAEGWTAHLRLFDEHGAAVTTRSWVWTFDRESPKVGEHGPITWSDPVRRPTIEWNPLTERYDVFFSEPTTAFAFARYRKLGSAFGMLELEADKQGHEFHAALRGGGELAGTLRDPVGEPLSGVSLIAYPSDWSSPENPLRSVIEIVRGGLCKATARTGRDGSFRFLALQPGTYVIAVSPPGSGRSAPRPRLPRKAFPLGTEGIDLQLAAYRLVIAVRDEHGEPVDRNRLRCFRDPGEDREKKISGHELEDGWFSFEVEPGAAYAYGWFEPDRELAEGVVTIEEGLCVTRRTLELAAPVEPQALQVDVLDENGQPLRMLFWSVGLELRSIATGLLLADPRVYEIRSIANPGLSETATKTLRLAPGRYELGAIPGHGFVWCGDTPTPPLPVGPVVQEVQVLPDRPNELEIRLWRGGRAHVSLDLPEDLRDPRLVIPEGTSRYGDWKRRNHLFTTKEDNPCATIYWEDPADDERKPLVARVIPGTDVTSPLLPPGIHELEVRAPHFQPATVQVLIRPGETVPVRVPLRY